MVSLSRLNGDIVFVNPDLVRWVEQRPDTVLTFSDDRTLVVQESPEQYRDKVIEYKKALANFATDSLPFEVEI